MSWFMMKRVRVCVSWDSGSAHSRVPRRGSVHHSASLQEVFPSSGSVNMTSKVRIMCWKVIIMSLASHNYDSKPYLRDFRLIMFYLIIMTHHGSISSSSPVDVNRFFTGRPCLPVTKKLAHSLARVARAAGDVRQQVG